MPRSNLRCSCRSVGMIGRLPKAGAPHAASGRLLFLVPVAVGLYRSQAVSRGRGDLWPEGQSQAGRAGRSFLRDRRIAVDEASSGAAALPDGGVAALARQARPELSVAAEKLA